MKRTQAETKYRRFSRQELKAAIKARSGEEAPAEAHWRQLIKKLDGLDRNQNFRFLDLAPELRNVVYELLLRRDPRRASENKASTGLLRTCKQVYKEGRGMLEAQSYALFDIGFYHYIDENRDRRVGCYAKGDLSFQAPGELVTSLPLMMSNELNAELTRFCRVQNLAITFRVVSQIQQPFDLLHEFFAQVVRCCPELRNLEIEWNGSDAPGAYTMPRLMSSLRPLIQLPSDTTLKFRNVKEDMVDQFWKEAAQAE